MGIEFPEVETVFITGKGEASDAWAKGLPVCAS